MGKKKKALLRYKRLGTISKKLEKKFANFLRANVDKINTKVEEALTKVEETLDKTQELIETAREEKEAKLIQVEEPAVEEKPKTTRKAKPRTATKKKATTSTAKKTTSTTRRKRTTKTKTDSQVICRELELVIMMNYNL